MPCLFGRLGEPPRTPVRMRRAAGPAGTAGAPRRRQADHVPCPPLRRRPWWRPPSPQAGREQDVRPRSGAGTRGGRAGQRTAKLARESGDQPSGGHDQELDRAGVDRGEAGVQAYGGEPAWRCGEDRGDSRCARRLTQFWTHPCGQLTDPGRGIVCGSTTKLPMNRSRTSPGRTARNAGMMFSCLPMTRSCRSLPCRACLSMAAVSA